MSVSLCSARTLLAVAVLALLPSCTSTAPGGGSAPDAESGFQGRVLERQADGSIGDPVSNVKLVFAPEDGGTVQRTGSDGEGAYRIALAPGRYVVEADHPGYQAFSTVPGFFVVQGPGFETGNIFLVPEAPGDEAPEGERLALGTTGPQEGPPFEPRDLPQKGDAVPLPAGEEQPPAEEIDPQFTDEPEGEPESDPEAGADPGLPVTTHLRIRLRMTRDSFEVEDVVEQPGRLPNALPVTGDYLYLVSAGGQVLHAGTFQDPLTGYGFDPDNDLGHSATALDEGAVTISAPSGLAEADADAVRVEFFRLPPSLPHDTKVSAKTARQLAESSEPLDAGVEGAAIFEQLDP